MANMAILGWSGLNPKKWVNCLKTCVDMVREVGNGFPWHMVKKHIFGQKSVFVTKSEENGIFWCVRRPFYKENDDFPKSHFGRVQRKIHKFTRCAPWCTPEKSGTTMVEKNLAIDLELSEPSIA